ncbi:MAG TPA: hypothetical protein VNA25_01610 [Phycisphaerae bacterium]|nr:hypothetical protein [Phycisphaerae bacterium]
MAITVRCPGCRKKVSVDDAFAGGACRCPYCKEIVLVRGGKGPKAAARPEGPTDRPEAPTDQAAAPEAALVAGIAETEEVPMANPVRFQGMVTIVLIGAIIAMTVLGIWLGVTLSRRAHEEPNAMPGPVAPPNRPLATTPVTSVAPMPATTPVQAGVVDPLQAAKTGPKVAGMSFTPPVIYVLDGGGSMKRLFDYARYMTWLSIQSLTPQQKFNILVSTEGGVKALQDGYRAGGREGYLATKEFLSEVFPGGQTDIAGAIGAAIAKSPSTIVVFRREAIEHPGALGAKAKAAGIVIVGVGLGSDRLSGESLGVLTAATGGLYEVFSEAALATWADSAPPLE